MRKIILILLVVMFFIATVVANAEEIELISTTHIDWAGTDSTQKYVTDGGDNYTYFYDGYYNIFSIDISDPTNPNQIGHINLGGSPGLERRIAKSGDYLYAPRSGSGTPDMNIVNISDPTNPTLVNSISAGTVRNIIAEDNYLYTTGDGPISVYDVSLPTNPSLEWNSSVTPTGIIFDIAIKDRYVYAVGEGPMSVVDATNKTVTSISFDDYANRAIVSGNFLYVGDRNSHLKIFDISSPMSPSLISTYPTIAGAPTAMAITGDKLFLASWGTLEGVDISNPLNPVQFDVFDGLETWDIYAKGDYVYASSNDGLQIFAITSESVVPEPTSMLLFGLGLLGAGVLKGGKK